MSDTIDFNEDRGLPFLEQMRWFRPDGKSWDMDEKEPEPTELNAINSSGGFLVMSTDKLSVKYTHVNLHGHDVGVVQANNPAPTKRFLYYFEIYVKNAGARGQIAIGFSGKSFTMRRQPGWEANSCGYHADEGMLYRGQGEGETFGPPYTSNDIVGGGILYASQQFFFTKNGEVVGTVLKDTKGPLFPTIAVHSQNEEVQVNFGGNPFAFDLKDFEAQERMKEKLVIEHVHIPTNISYGIVRAYLLHYGYEDTLYSFDTARKSTVPPNLALEEDGINVKEIFFALNRRKTLRELIWNSQIDAAIGKLRDWYPHIIQDSKSVVCFLLRCQKFLELVRDGNLDKAVKYRTTELDEFYSVPAFLDIIQDCVALIAYEDPLDSSVAYLLKDTQREIVADTVNAMILLTNPKAEFRYGVISHLELFLKQLTACSFERRKINGNEGEVFQLHRVLELRREGKW